jgi:hypothetical protein
MFNKNVDIKLSVYDKYKPLLLMNISVHQQEFAQIFSPIQTTGTRGQDPIMFPPPLFFPFFFEHRFFFHINNILQLSMYHCMTFIQ